MAQDSVRSRLESVIARLNQSQQQRLLEWAGSMNASISGARAPGASIGPLAEVFHITNLGSEREGHARYQLEVVPELLNPHGVLHGGAIYTMVDYSMGGATMSALPAGEICATIEIKISYLAGVTAGRLTADTNIIKRGKRVVFLESRVVDDAGRIVASASGSFAVIRPGAD